MVELSKNVWDHILWQLLKFSAYAMPMSSKAQRKTLLEISFLHQNTAMSAETESIVESKPVWIAKNINERVWTFTDNQLYKEIGLIHWSH